MKNQIQKPHRKTLLARARKAFSLVELLVVIAVIGIIAAIAIPNIANINQSATDAKDQRNAQSIASVYASAKAAGATTAGTDVPSAVTEITSPAGVVPTSGAFKDQVFRIEISSTERDTTHAQKYLAWDAAAKTLVYQKP